jgi:hypothetical protein
LAAGGGAAGRRRHRLRHRWLVGPKREGLEKRQRKKKSTAEAEHVRKMDDEGVTHLPYRTRTTQ